MKSCDKQSKNALAFQSLFLHKKPYILLIKAALLFGALLAVIVLSRRTPDKTTSVDLLHAGGWAQGAGAEVVPEGILFRPTKRSIIHQDGSAAQANPPVNFGGSHLNVRGDFRITFVVSGMDKHASFRLYTQPPIVYDQWRHEGPSIAVAIEKNLLTARIWDGSSSTSLDERTYPVFLTHTTTFSLERTKEQVTLRENNRVLGSMPDHNIFESGDIWFGAENTAKETTWTLTSLHAQGIGAGHVDVVPAPSVLVAQTDQNSLRHLADAHPRKLPMGAALAIGPLFTDEDYRKIALGQFSMLTPENSMKPQFIHPEPTVYAFEEADQLVDAAIQNTMLVHGHALVYHKSNPEWMTKSPKEQRQKILLDHVKTVVTHFQGKVASWDVVNEPFSQKRTPYTDGKRGLEPNIWFEAMGEEYIDLAFKTAHAADPSAKLYLNDYGLENDGEHWDAFLGLVKRLKQRGVPIDGVGFEAHVYSDSDYIKASELKKHIQLLAKLGLSARISEIDVTGDDAQEQTKQYVTVLDVCLREPTCTSYTTWGITDRYGSTTRSDRYPLVYGTSLLWDKNLKTKPAYSALQKRLQQAN